MAEFVRFAVSEAEDLEAFYPETPVFPMRIPRYIAASLDGLIPPVAEAKTEEPKQTRIERTVELAEKELRAYDENNKRRL